MVSLPSSAAVSALSVRSKTAVSVAEEAPEPTVMSKCSAVPHVFKVPLPVLKSSRVVFSALVETNWPSRTAYAAPEPEKMILESVPPVRVMVFAFRVASPPAAALVVFANVS